MNIVWSPRALRDLDEILDYIQQRSPAGASNVSLAIERSVAICARHPQLGSKTDEPGVYRWPLGTYRYTFFYRHVEADNTIEIICLLRSGRIRSLRRIPDEL
jgi:toxin ParE1/3/4